MCASTYLVGERRLMVPKGCENLNKCKEFMGKLTFVVITL